MEPPDRPLIGVIGAGRLARAFVAGLGEPVLIASRTRDRAQNLADSVGGEVVADNRTLGHRAAVIVIAVEPGAFDEVADQIRPVVEGKLVISLLARTPLTKIQQALPDATVARAMPNVAMQIGRSTTCISMESEAGPRAVAATRELFERLGATYEVADEHMNVVTWLCGSGPAWTSLIVESEVQAAVEAGLDRAIAEVLAVQTLRATTELLARSPDGNVDAQRVAADTLDAETAARLVATVRDAGTAAFDAAVSTPAPSAGPDPAR